jgi:hypothetical protein
MPKVDKLLKGEKRMKAQQIIDECSGKETPAEALCKKIYSFSNSKAGVNTKVTSFVKHANHSTPASYTACECTTDIIIKKPIMAEELI